MEHGDTGGTIQMSALVSFDVTVHVGDTCPLRYYVDETTTTLYFGETCTSATVVLANPALLALAEVTRHAVGAVLSVGDTPHRAESRTAADSPDAMSPHPAVWIDAGVTIADGCPISFEVHGTVVHIVVLDTTTLCLTFWHRTLLEFARLVGEAARIVRHTSNEAP